MIIWSYDHMIVGRHTVTIERYRVPPKRGAQRAPRIGGTYPHRGDRSNFNGWSPVGIHLDSLR